MMPSATTVGADRAGLEEGDDLLADGGIMAHIKAAIGARANRRASKRGRACNCSLIRQQFCSANSQFPGYPPWTDPSFWNEGLQAHFKLRPQMEVLARTVPSELRLLFRARPELVAG